LRVLGEFLRVVIRVLGHVKFSLMVGMFLANGVSEFLQAVKMILDGIDNFLRGNLVVEESSSGG
jgi:hypothetical protein